jgi:hypothetical protein
MSPDIVADLIETLEGEVNNGGFDQFFYNSAGNNTADTILALQAIGAARTADIVKRAAAMFPGGGMPLKSDWRGARSYVWCPPPVRPLTYWTVNFTDITTISRASLKATTTPH